MHTSIRLHLDLFPNGLTRLLGTSACFPLLLIPVETVRPQESGISPDKIYVYIKKIQQEFYGNFLHRGQGGTTCRADAGVCPYYSPALRAG